MWSWISYHAPTITMGQDSIEMAGSPCIFPVLIINGWCYKLVQELYNLISGINHLPQHVYV